MEKCNSIKQSNKKICISKTKYILENQGYCGAHINKAIKVYNKKYNTVIKKEDITIFKYFDKLNTIYIKQEPNYIPSCDDMNIE